MTARPLFWFNADFPSVFKRYFDTQLALLDELGVPVVPMAFRPGPGPYSALCNSRDLGGRTRYLTDDLAAVRTRWRDLARVLLTERATAARRGVRAFGAAGPIRRRLGFVARALGFPAEQPAALFINNLETLVKLRFLRRLYPETPLGFYYHGGEPAGVPAVDATEARLALQVPDVVFTNTSFSAEDVIARGARREAVEVVPLGYRLEDYPFRPVWPRAVDGSPITVISIGRLSLEKGHAIAIKAVALARRRSGLDLRYHLVGAGPERGNLQRQVQDAGMAGWVAFHGALADGDPQLVTLLASAHVAVQPSITVGDWSENQGCVLQELMLLGIPVIASRVGGMPECIAPGLRQIMPEAGSPEALAEALCSFLQDTPAAITATVVESRQFVEQQFEGRALLCRILDRLGLKDRPGVV